LLPVLLPEERHPSVAPCGHDLRRASELRGLPCQEPGRLEDIRLPACKRSKIIFNIENMSLSWENVELRGFEPLTFCMPYKNLPYRNVAGYGPTSSFNRWTSPGIA